MAPYDAGPRRQRHLLTEMAQSRRSMRRMEREVEGCCGAQTPFVCGWVRVRVRLPQVEAELIDVQSDFVGFKENEVLKCN